MLQHSHNSLQRVRGVALATVASITMRGQSHNASTSHTLYLGQINGSSHTEREAADAINDICGDRRC